MVCRPFLLVLSIILWSPNIMAMYIKTISFAAAGLVTKSWMRGDYDPEKLLREYQAEVDRVIEAVLGEEEDLDILLAHLVEDMPGEARIALVKKVQELVRARDEEKAQALQAYLTRLEEQHKQRQQEAKRQSWLSFFMSRETLKKIREALLSRPAMNQEVQNIGQELARKGILQSLQFGDVKELGGLSTNAVQTAREFGKEKDGRWM